MNDYFMDLALREAQKAYKNGDIPVGAVIVRDGVVLSKAYNKKQKNGDPTEHAEILAIRKACKKIKDFRLENCEMYITLEPCLMCYGAILSARIDRVYFGAFDKRFSVLNISKDVCFNHSTEMIGGLKEKECSELLSKFFAELRRENADTSKKDRNS